jgi:hypothetical protein
MIAKYLKGKKKNSKLLEKCNCRKQFQKGALWAWEPNIWGGDAEKQVNLKMSWNQLHLYQGEKIHL